MDVSHELRIDESFQMFITSVKLSCERFPSRNGAREKEIKFVRIPPQKFKEDRQSEKRGLPFPIPGVICFHPQRKGMEKKEEGKIYLARYTHNWPTTTCMHHSFVKKRAPRTKHLEASEQMAEREEMNAEATPQIGSQENEWVILHARRRFFCRESYFFRTTERWCSCIWTNVYESTKGVSFPEEKKIERRTFAP